MRKLALILLFTLPLAYGLDISEVMFDPSGADYNKEWIELIGNDNLSGCTITDSHSTDELELLQEGTKDIILIAESDHMLEFPDDAWVYGAGAAIGNGLGNSGDDMIIECNEILLNTSYGPPDDFISGYSIMWDDEWILGTENGTPGKVELAEDLQEEIITDSEESKGKPCNNTLIVTVSSTNVTQGDEILFTIVSAGYSTWEASLDGEMMARGNTLATNEHMITPADEGVLTIQAFQSECRGEQRYTRKILVNSKQEIPPPIEDIPEKIEENVTPKPQENRSIRKAVQEEREEVNLTPTITGQVIYDENQSAIPWISSFGIVTLLISAGLFWHVSREEKNEN